MEEAGGMPVNSFYIRFGILYSVYANENYFLETKIGFPILNGYRYRFHRLPNNIDCVPNCGETRV